MKRITILIVAGSLFADLALSQPRKRGYTVTDLGPVGDAPGGIYAISPNSLAAGAAETPDGTAMHAVLWPRGQKFDLGKNGVGHANSVANGVNSRGQVVGQADTINSNGANDFCGFSADGFKSTTTCLPFLWQSGILRMLPTLGGANGIANKINERGQAVGLAETTISDAGCPVARFEPVVWEDGGVRRLSISVPRSTDTYGMAVSINDKGQVSGSSGTCGPFNAPAQTYMVLNHALLWDADGTPHDLGNLGGAGGLAGNHACAVNNQGQVAGHSELTGNTTFHAFLWADRTGMVDLGTLPGDSMSLANGLNDAGEVVGASIGAGFSTFAAVRWDSNGISDLNSLVTANPTGLYLLIAFWIGSSGEIVGIGVGPDGAHGFVATPNNGQDNSPALASITRPVLTGATRELVIKKLRIRLP